MKILNRNLFLATSLCLLALTGCEASVQCVSKKHPNQGCENKETKQKKQSLFGRRSKCDNTKCNSSDDNCCCPNCSKCFTQSCKTRTNADDRKTQ